MKQILRKSLVFIFCAACAIDFGSQSLQGQTFSVFEEVDRWGGDIGPPPVFINDADIAFSYMNTTEFVNGVTVYFTTIYITDFSDPDSPELLSSTKLEITQPGGLLENDGLLFVRNFRGVYILDVSNPSNVQELGFAQISATGDSDSFGMSYHDDHLYVNGYNNDASGLVAINVGNPEQPLVTSILPDSSNPQQITVLNGHLFTRGEFGIAIYSISSPASPANPSFIMEYFPEVPQFPSDVEIDYVVAQGTHLYAAGRFEDKAKFYSIDITDPSNPALLESIDYGTSEEVNGLHLSGNMVFVQRQAFSDEEIYSLVNVSDPANLSVSGPRLLGRDERPIIHVTPTRAYIYVDQMRVYDISHANFFMEAGSDWGDLNKRLLAEPIYSSIRQIHLSGRTILAARGDAGIERLSVTGKGFFNHLQRIDIGASVQSLMPHGEYLHVSTYSEGDVEGHTYLVYKMNELPNGDGSRRLLLTKQSGAEVSDSIRDIALTGDLAILAATGDGLYVYDWSNPINVQLQANYVPSGFPAPPIDAVDVGSVRLSSYGYYVIPNREASSIGLETFAPIDLQAGLGLVTSFGVTTRYFDIEARDGSLFGMVGIAAGELGFVIADTGPIAEGGDFLNGFSNVGQYRIITGGHSGRVQSLALYASYAFLGVTGGDAGIIVVDFSNRQNLIEVASFDGITNVRDIAVSSDYVFAVDSDAGLVSIAWSDDGFTGPLPDFDNDGASDALESFFGNNIEVPGENDGALPSPQLVEDNGQRFLEITFNVAADLDPNIYWELESAARIDSSFWIPVEGALISQDGTTVTARVPAGSIGEKYVRLAIQFP